MDQIGRPLPETSSSSGVYRPYSPAYRPRIYEPPSQPAYDHAAVERQRQVERAQQQMAAEQARQRAERLRLEAEERARREAEQRQRERERQRQINEMLRTLDVFHGGSDHAPGQSDPRLQRLLDSDPPPGQGRWNEFDAPGRPSRPWRAFDAPAAEQGSASPWAEFDRPAADDSQPDQRPPGGRLLDLLEEN